MIQIAPDIYEKTLKKFKRVKMLLFIYALVSIGIVIGTTFLNNSALTFLLIVLFISLAIGFILPFRKKLTRAVIETAAQIVIQEFDPDIDTEKWSAEQEEEFDSEINQKFFYKKDLSTIAKYFGKLFIGTDLVYDIDIYFGDVLLFGKKDNINFSLRGRLPILQNEDFLPTYYALRVGAQLIKDNIIIISPLKYYSQKNSKNLPKADIDTGTKYNVYAQKPNEIPTQIREHFIPVVIDYAKTLHTWVVTIITSDDIYFISQQDNTLKFVVFASAQKQIFDKVAEYKELLEIINAVSLLNKKD